MIPFRWKKFKYQYNQSEFVPGNDSKGLTVLVEQLVQANKCIAKYVYIQN